MRIHKVLLFMGLFVAMAGTSQAQVPNSFPYAKTMPNDSGTGTTQFKLVKINSSGNAVIMATTDTAGYTGIAIQNAGQTGTVTIAFAGLAPCVIDGTATVDHYVQISSSVAGDCHDSGATTYPTSGGDVIGRVQSVGTAGGGAGTAVVDLFPPEFQASAASAPTFPISAQTASYSVVAADFSNCRTITMSSTSATTVTLLATAPTTSGQCILVEDVNTGAVSIALNGRNANGSSVNPPALNQNQGYFIQSDGTNYVYELFAGPQGTYVNFDGDINLLTGGSLMDGGVVNSISLTPFFVQNTVTGITKLFMSLNTADAGANSYDIGIYGPWVAGGGTCNRIVNIGATSMNIATGYQEFTVSSTNLTGGFWYIFATTGNASTAKISYTSMINQATPFSYQVITGGGATLPASITCPAVGWAFNPTSFGAGAH